MPEQGECSLFLQANTLETITEFQALVQTALIRDPDETLLGIQKTVDWTRYLRSDTFTRPDVQTQCGPTCWAHAIGTVVHLATSRVLGREGGQPTFASVREHCYQRMTEVRGTDARDLWTAVWQRSWKKLKASTAFITKR